MIIKILESNSCEVSKEKYNKSKQTKKTLDPRKHKGGVLHLQGFLFQVTLSLRQLSVSDDKQKAQRDPFSILGETKLSVLMLGTFELCLATEQFCSYVPHCYFMILSRD